MSSLAEATGLNIGETQVSKLNPVIVRSERILRGVRDHEYKTSKHPEPVNLAKYWEINPESENDKFDRALKMLRARLDVSFEMRLETVTIAVDIEEPQLAADVANKISSEMDEYTRTKRRTNATLQHEFIEVRMQEVEQQLEKSEVTLKDILERNRRVLDSPQLMLEQERLARDVQTCPDQIGVNSTVFIELKKQLEIAKIEEIKNIPIINVVEPARPPVTKSYPTRRSAALAALAFSLVLGVAYAGFKDHATQALKGLRLAIANRHPAELDATLGDKKRLGTDFRRSSNMFFGGRQHAERSSVSDRKEDRPKANTSREMPSLDCPPGLPDQIESSRDAHLAYSAGTLGCCFSGVNTFEV